jgi:hypothetical protein
MTNNHDNRSRQAVILRSGNAATKNLAAETPRDEILRFAQNDKEESPWTP